MEYTKAARAFDRMCRCHVNCKGCPVLKLCEIGGRTLMFRERAKELEPILEKWDAEHPEKTFADDFFEKHPNAPKNSDGLPKTCVCNCGYLAPLSDGGCPIENLDCVKCWHHPLEV